MEVKQLTILSIRPDMLTYFDRYQEVTQCWRRDASEWILKDVLYTRQWDENKKAWAIGYFSWLLEQGGIIMGAFDEHKLIGFAAIDGKLFGSQDQYVNLNLLIVSYGYRNKGIGGRLFVAISEKAIDLYAKKLYISAHSSKDSIAFYKRMGCKDAQEIIPDLIDEPFDLQLEYDLSCRR